MKQAYLLTPKQAAILQKFASRYILEHNSSLLASERRVVMSALKALDRPLTGIVPQAEHEDLRLWGPRP